MSTVSDPHWKLHTILMVNNYNYGTTVLEDILKHIGISFQGADYLISKTQTHQQWNTGRLLNTNCYAFHCFSKILVNGLQLLKHIHCSPQALNSHLTQLFTPGKIPSAYATRKSSVNAAAFCIMPHSLKCSICNTPEQKCSESWAFCSSVWHKSRLQLCTWLNSD